MNRRGHRGKVDSTQAPIKAIAEAHGWQVVSTAGVGDGFPDLLCWRRVEGYRLVECKSKGGTLTPTQKRFRERFSIPIVHVSSADEAERVFGAVPHDILRDSNGNVRPRAPHDGGSYDDHQLRRSGEGVRR